MMNSHQQSSDGARMSLREEAMARRRLQQQSAMMSSASGESPYDEGVVYNSFRGGDSERRRQGYDGSMRSQQQQFQYRQQQQHQQQGQMMHSSSNHNAAMMVQNSQPPLPQTLQSRSGYASLPYPSTSSLPAQSTPSTMQQQQQQQQGTISANEARKQWQQHGDSLSQALEERRSALLTTATASSSPVSYSVKITSTETRIDPSGSPYTTYILCIQKCQNQNQTATNIQSYTIEHRYSDFAKLNSQLNANSIQLRSTFPSKSWAGRIGNWTPSLSISPDKNKDLIEFRMVKLDLWLVELCELLNKGGIQGGLRDMVIDFLTVGCGSRHPCDAYNFVDWDDGGLVGSSESINTSSGSRSSMNDGRVMVEQQQSLNDRNYQRYSTTASSSNASATTTQHAAIGPEKHLSNPLSFTLGSSIRQATYTVMKMCCGNFAAPNSKPPRLTTTTTTATASVKSSDQSIPLDLLHSARGLCFLTVVKAGFVISGRFGTGLIIRRLSDRQWSAPSAVGTIGMGYGALLGGDITNYLIVLTTEKAVKAFGNHNGTVNLGGEVGVSVGPLGRSATGNVTTTGGGSGGGEGGVGGLAPAYAYAHSKGFFVGISLEGSIISSRPDVNAKFYGRPIDASSLLYGNVQSPPRAAQPLYDALEQAMKVDIPSDGFRPSRVFDGSGQQQQRQQQHYGSNSAFSHISSCGGGAGGRTSGKVQL